MRPFFYIKYRFDLQTAGKKATMKLVNYEFFVNITGEKRSFYEALA